jgi:hypothetical protein
MANIDIDLPESLKKALTPPVCLDLSLPKPSLPQIRLPTGGTFKAISDITKGIPDDCSATFNIALQLAPMMASMECLLKVLKFVGELIKVFDELKSGNPTAIPAGLGKIVDAGADLATSCLLIPTPFVMAPFVKDLLAMLAKMLHCAAQTLRSAIEVLDGIELDLASAKTNGNDELAAQLQCAQENAQLAMDGAMVSLEPVMVLLELASPFLEIAQQSVAIGPFVSDGTLDGMKSVLESIDSAATLLQSVSDAIPG